MQEERDREDRMRQRERQIKIEASPIKKAILQARQFVDENS